MQALNDLHKSENGPNGGHHTDSRSKYAGKEEEKGAEADDIRLCDKDETQDPMLSCEFGREVPSEDVNYSQGVSV
jgi:hypothetical protein